MWKEWLNMHSQISCSLRKSFYQKMEKLWKKYLAEKNPIKINWLEMNFSKKQQRLAGFHSESKNMYLFHLLLDRSQSEVSNFYWFSMIYPEKPKHSICFICQIILWNTSSSFQPWKTSGSFYFCLTEFKL